MMINFTTTYDYSKTLRRLGVKQTSLHYYHIKTKDVYHVNDVPHIRDFDKFYMSAFVDTELDQFIPDGVTLEKKKGEWIAKYKDYFTKPHVAVANAKAELIIILERREFIHL